MQRFWCSGGHQNFIQVLGEIFVSGGVPSLMMSSQKEVEAVLSAFQFCFDSFLFLFFKLYVLTKLIRFSDH